MASIMAVSRKSNPPDANRMLTVAEVAKLLRRSPNTVYRWARKGEIPARKVGGVWVISETALAGFLNGFEAPRPEWGRRQGRG